MVPWYLSIAIILPFTTNHSDVAWSRVMYVMLYVCRHPSWQRGMLLSPNRHHTSNLGGGGGDQQKSPLPNRHHAASSAIRLRCRCVRAWFVSGYTHTQYLSLLIFILFTSLCASFFFLRCCFFLYLRWRSKLFSPVSAVSLWHYYCIYNK